MSRTKDLKKKLLKMRAPAKKLVNYLGPEVTDSLLGEVLASGYITPQIANKATKDDQILDYVDQFLDLEWNNLLRTGSTIGALVAKLDVGALAPLIAANTLPGASYGVVNGESASRQAARWVCNASNTTRGNIAEINATEKIIDMAVRVSSLTAIQSLDAINTALMVGGGRAQPRGPVLLPMPSPLPSSMGGRFMLEAAIGFLGSRIPGNPNCAYDDLGCYLLGVTIGCHGFPDANGRTGRVLYAICQVKAGNGFAGLTTAGEVLLHGL